MPPLVEVVVIGLGLSPYIPIRWVKRTALVGYPEVPNGAWNQVHRDANPERGLRAKLKA